MADKEQQSTYPTATANGYSRRDTESAAAHDARELRRKKRNKCILYIVLFVIFQTGIIALFGLTVMKIRTPKFRVRSGTIENLQVGTAANPSFSGRLNAELGVRNTNFGRYKYQSTSVVFSYRGAQVGEFTVPNSRAGWRSTKKIDVPVDLSLPNAGANPQFVSDLSSGVLPLTSQARMRGRVELMFVMKKNRSTNMNCTMEIVVATGQLRNIACK